MTLRLKPEADVMKKEIAAAALALTGCATAPTTANWVPLPGPTQSGRAIVRVEFDRGNMRRKGQVTSVWVRGAYVDEREAGPPSKPAAWEYAMHDVNCHEHTLVIHPRVSFSPTPRPLRADLILFPQRPQPGSFEARLLAMVCPVAVPKRPRPGNRL